MMHENGFDIEEIDGAMVKWGMPMGPFRLMDEIGLDICQHVAVDLYNRLPHLGGNLPSTINDLVADNFLGKKSGEGFYKYKKGKSIKRGVKVDPTNAKLIVSTLTNCMVDECHKILVERVVESRDDIDFAMILGTGFAPFRGGPLSLDVNV